MHKWQVCYFSEKQNIINPKSTELFDHDLTTKLENWINMGDQIVLDIYTNKSVEY